MHFAPIRLIRPRIVRTVVVALAFFSLVGSALANSDVTVKGGLSKGGKYIGRNPKVFTPTKPVSVAGVGSVKTHLNYGRSVTVTTESIQAGNGDLSVTAEVVKTTRKTPTLSLHAKRDLLVTKPIRATKGTLSVELKADRKVAVSAPITTNGGNIAIQTQEPFALSTALSAGAGRILIQGGSLESVEPQTLTASAVEVAAGAALKLRGNVTGSLSVAGTLSPGPASAFGLQVGGGLSLQPSATTTVNFGSGWLAS
jgi:hypothetical protein